MKSENTIYGRQIKNVVTKFFYEENNLCFQILLDLNEESMVYFNDYTDYTEYKADFNNLVKIKAGNLTLNFPRISAGLPKIKVG